MKLTCSVSPATKTVSGHNTAKSKNGGTLLMSRIAAQLDDQGGSIQAIETAGLLIRTTYLQHIDHQGGER